MIDKKDAEIFIGKRVGVLYNDTGEDIYAKGILSQITEKSVVLERFGDRRSILVSLDSIKLIKEMGESKFK